MNGQKINRMANLELLRIISMLMIVSLHFWSRCVNLNELPTFSNAFFLGNFIRGFSYPSVNIYVLISAYFLCRNTPPLKFSKLLKLWLCVAFYSILGYIAAIILGFANFTLSGLIRFLTPIASAEFWFVTVYFGLYCVSPFINLFIAKLEKKTYIVLLSVLTLLYVIVPSIFWSSSWIGIGKGYTLSWFIYLYLVGAYIRRYYNIENISKRVFRWIVIACIVLVFMPLAVCILSNIASLLIFSKTTGGHDLWFNNSIIIFPLSLFIFLCFLHIKVARLLTGPINKVAMSTLAVYLIHEHPLLREHIWDFFRQMIANNFYSLVAIFCLSIFTIYTLCTIIDLFRIIIFKHSVDKVNFNRLDERLMLYYHRFNAKRQIV